MFVSLSFKNLGLWLRNVRLKLKKFYNPLDIIQIKAYTKFDLFVTLRGKPVVNIECGSAQLCLFYEVSKIKGQKVFRKMSSGSKNSINAGLKHYIDI